MPNPQLEKLISEFAKQIEAVVRQDVIESLQSVLGGGAVAVDPATSGGRPRGKLAKAGSRPVEKVPGKRARRSVAQLKADVTRLVAFVKANPGATSESVRASLKMSKSAWIIALRRSLAAKALSTKGQKRSTTLHPAKG